MESHDVAGHHGPSPNKHLGVIGAIFALLVAPIVAGIIANIGSFFVQKKLEAPNDPPPASSALTAKPQVILVEKPVAVATSAPTTPSAPSPDLGRPAIPAFQQALASLHALPVNHLFNGRDLAGFYTYIGPPQPDGEPIGKNKDPDKIFSVKNGVLAISGRESGGLATVDAYENYLLTVEYRWGTRSYRPRLALPKSGAIIFHAVGPDGALRGAWLQGFRARLDENGGGDIGIWRHASPDPHLSVEVEPHVVTTLKKLERTHYTYKPGGTPRTIEPGGFALRLGTINDVARSTPGASPGTVWERPSGEWNTLEILCVGDAIGIIFNGTLVNAASKASRTKGKIQLTCDKADIFFRTVDLRAIPRGFPTLAGMPHPSPHAALAKAIQKKSPVAAETSQPAKTKVPGRGARSSTKK